MALRPKIGLAPIVRSPGKPVGAVPPTPAATIDGNPAWLAVARSRPRYFDGRFLAARDLERDQRYFAARQAEALRAAGPGVIHGLVPRMASDSALAVTAGAAITAGGELVVLRGELELPLFDLAETQRLDQVFGLSSTPRDVARRRTGVFVLLARPVEYTGDPIGLYPAELPARREPEDGDTIEAVAFTLAPYHDAVADAAVARQRSAIARRIFVEGAEVPVPTDAVALAIVRLERGFVQWVDAWLARRELGDKHGGIAAFARAPRAVAEAQLQQYQVQLAAIAADRAAAGKPLVWSAGEELAALPPAGAFPVAALDLAGQTERFFPQATPVSLQVVPDDEIPAVLAESLAMPPFDLAAGDAALAATPVAVLIAAPRGTVEGLPPELRGFALRSAAVAPGRARSRGSLALEPIAARFASMSLVDDRGHRLAAALGGVTTAYYARLRRALGATQDGIVAIERQLIH